MVLVQVTETLALGAPPPERDPGGGGVPTRARTWAVGFVCGVAAGIGTHAWWSSAPAETPAPPVAVDPSVQLVFTGVADRHRSGGSRAGEGGRGLWLDAVLVHVAGRGTATVTRVHRPGAALDLHVPGLPARLAPGEAREVLVRLSPRECRLAGVWTPSSRPFTVTWSDTDGRSYSTSAGDHNSSMEVSWLRHMDAACPRRSGS